MQQPVWYKDTEKVLLEHGKPAIALGLILLIAISLFFLIALLGSNKYSIPAAAWVTYMFMP